MGTLKDQIIRREDSRLGGLYVGQLADQGAHVEAWCNRCGDQTMMDREYLMKRVGPDVMVAEVGVYVACPGCGSKDVAARPVWWEVWEEPRAAING